MTNLKRISAYIPEELEKKLMAEKKTDKYAMASMSKLISDLLERGFELEAASAAKGN